MRTIAVIGAAGLLAGCVTTTSINNADTGNWKIERGYDRILGKPSGTAELVSRSRNEQQRKRLYPHGELQLGALQLVCFDNAPVIRIRFNHRIGSNRTSTVSYRFDEKPGRDVSARFLQTYTTALIEEPQEVAQFVEQLRTSDKLYVRVMSHVAGTSSVEFSLKGAPLAIEAAYQSCPADSSPRTRTADSSARNMRRSVST
jgi:hypothetical protein